MEILVQGGRTATSDWQAVRRVPVDQLPTLTEAQRAVAERRGLRPEEYARQLLAEQRTTERLASKTERFAKVFEQRLKSCLPQAFIEQVALSTIEEKFELVVFVNGKRIPARVNESLVDDLFEGGSAEADQRLTRIVEMLLAGERAA